MRNFKRKTLGFFDVCRDSFGVICTLVIFISFKLVFLGANSGVVMVIPHIFCWHLIRTLIGFFRLRLNCLFIDRQSHGDFFQCRLEIASDNSFGFSFGLGKCLSRSFDVLHGVCQVKGHFLATQLETFRQIKLGERILKQLVSLCLVLIHRGVKVKVVQA